MEEEYEWMLWLRYYLPLNDDFAPRTVFVIGHIFQIIVDDRNDVSVCILL
jgi:hypothetical protein